MPRPAEPVQRLHTTSFVSIQYMRGIAAIAVVYFHTKVYLPQFSWPLDRSFGYAGVDIFFAISGFIMTVTSFGRDQTTAHFVVKRALRIYPIYWIATGAALAAFLMVPSAFAKGAGIDATYIIASLLLIPIHSDAAASDGVPFLKIAWTLVFEVFFYAVFAMSLGLTHWTGRLVTIACVIVGLVAYGEMGAPQSAILRFYTNPLMLEFVFGCLAGYLVLSDRVWISRPVLASLLAVSLVLIGIGSGHGDRFARLAWFGIPAAVAVFCCASYERHHGPVPSVPMLRLFGDASYSIYLFQSFLLIAVRLAVDRTHLPIHEAAVGIPGIVGAVMLVVAGGTLIHIWIERPCLLAARRIERAVFKSHGRRPMLLGKPSV